MTYSRKNINSLLNLAKAHSAWPLQPGKDEAPGNEARELVRDLESHFEREDACVITTGGADYSDAAGWARLLEWDTEFFGYPCARIEGLMAAGDNETRRRSAGEVVQGILDWCVKKEVRFINVKVPGPDPAIIQALMEKGFYFADSVMELERDSAAPIPQPVVPKELTIHSNAGDTDLAAARFSSLFYDGRFHNDPHISKKKADSLWEAALRSQLQERARHFFFLRNEKEDIGLATFQAIGGLEGKDNGLTGSLFFFGILREFQGRGLGRSLLAESLSKVEADYKRIKVETSTYNFPALRLYQAFGFKPGRVKMSMHLRFD